MLLATATSGHRAGTYQGESLPRQLALEWISNTCDSLKDLCCYCNCSTCRYPYTRTTNVYLVHSSVDESYSFDLPCVSHGRPLLNRPDSLSKDSQGAETRPVFQPAKAAIAFTPPLKMGNSLKQNARRKQQQPQPPTTEHHHNPSIPIAKHIMQNIHHWAASSMSRWSKGWVNCR